MRSRKHIYVFILALVALVYAQKLLRAADNIALNVWQVENDIDKITSSLDEIESGLDYIESDVSSLELHIKNR